MKEIFVHDNFSLVADCRTQIGKIIVEAGAKAEICVVVFPGEDADVDIDIELRGEGAKAVLSGFYVCGGDERVDIKTNVRHTAGGCVSVQLFNGIAGASSRVSFDGKIYVAKDAQKTEAYQTNHNILLSTAAKVDTKPQLEIYADDVKCSHGATVGSLNADEQFYMRSRGIPEKEAKVLQMISFIAPVLEHIEDKALKEELLIKAENAVRSIV